MGVFRGWGAERPRKGGVGEFPHINRQAGRRPARQQGGEAAHSPVSQRLPVPARASLCKEVKRPIRKRTIDLPVSTMRWETSGFM